MRMSKLGEINSEEYKQQIRTAIEAMPTEKRFTKEDIVALFENASPADSMVIGETLLKMSSGHPMSIKRGNRYFCWFGNNPRKYYWTLED